MKTIKIITLGFLGRLCRIIWIANLRRLSVIEKLKPVNLTSLRIHGAMSMHDRLELERKISASPGVTLSKEGK